MTPIETAEKNYTRTQHYVNNPCINCKIVRRIKISELCKGSEQLYQKRIARDAENIRQCVANSTRELVNVLQETARTLIARCKSMGYVENNDILLERIRTTLAAWHEKYRREKK